MVPSTKTTFVSSCTNSVVILRYETICRAHMETALFGEKVWSVFTWRHGGHIGVLKHWNGGHVGVPNQSSGSWTLYWGLPPFRVAQLLIRFSVVCAKKRSPGGGKTRGSGTEKRCSHKWFHTIFPCTDSCTNTFCTSSPPLETQKALRTWRRLFASFEVIRSEESHYKFCHCSSLF